MSTITIEKGIPMPPITRVGPRTTRYPYADMDVDTSFGIPYVAEASDEDKDVAKRRMRQSVTWANRRFAPAKFAMREVQPNVDEKLPHGGIRIWRTI